MFFPEKIIHIKEGDRVLEIGPGASPFHRSDVLLEMKYDDESEYEKQFGHGDKLITDKPVVFYDGTIFPFKDREFDYVICSHVLEHVPDVPKFLSEVFRVAPKGYFEFPLIYYEYLYNIDAHISFLRFDDPVLYYLPKKNTTLQTFKPVQMFLLESLRNGHSKMIEDMTGKFIQGFEWLKPFESVEVSDISKLVHPTLEMPAPKSIVPVVEKETVVLLFKKLIKKIVGRP